MTDRLYLSDSYLTRFEAHILQTLALDGQAAVVLDRTAFYPEGGGQPGDRGELGQVRVVDTQERDGEVLHLLAASDATQVAVGQTIEGRIDWQRRFDHIQQHHGQHLLSAAFERVYRAPTQSFHLGEQTCTIDLGCPLEKLDGIALRAAESAANESIWQDHPVIAREFVGEERARLSLRKEPVKGNRIILVEGVDASPCGGTHPRRTGEVGCVAILRAQRWGQAVTRVEFVCGNRVVKALLQATDLVARTAEALRCAPPEVADAAARVVAESQARRKALEALETEWAGQKADQLVAASPAGPIVQAIAGGAQAAKLLASSLAKRGRIALIGARQDDRAHVCFARPPGPGPAMNTALKETLALLNGKGGGSAENAQGSGESARLDEALEAAARAIRSAL